MSNFKLTAQTPLNGFDQNFGSASDGIKVSELLGHSLVSMAMPDDQKDALAKNIKAAYDVNLPEIGKFTASTVDNTRILRLQQEQCFVLFENKAANEANDTSSNAVPHIREKTKDAAYLSDQSDSWVMLKLSGKNVKTALERVCPIDLQPPAFNTFSVTRTAMEHLSVIIMQEGENEYLLFSPRSSAKSFMHMILTSIENVS
ncbi:hypothetical protein GCM10009133_00810 [Cocleimonas flava]|uniref:Sarcosine oxidase subunit gamma n=1 Tax=Cocleimonas flava TaxID=634765 RepID=A0A4R1ETS9_9GAMM|nr:hypothetical protein [Cocleimonas flava]TCJ85056.1 sarcosine oxidase subunit gamma [Cocleimonas flava]